MSTPLQDKLLAAALLDPNLPGLLGSTPFRWYFGQLTQGSAYPAVVTQEISRVPRYMYAGRATRPVQCRIQFTIWGGQFDAGRKAALSVEAALRTFLDQFNAIGIGGLVQYPNYVSGARDGFYTQTDPLTFQRLVDAMMWDNETI